MTGLAVTVVLSRTRAWGEKVPSKLKVFKPRRDESTMARFLMLAPKLSQPTSASEKGKSVKVCQNKSPTCNVPQNDSCLCHKMESLSLKLQLSDVLDDHRLQPVHLLAARAAEQEDGPQLEEGAVGDREVSDVWWEACLVQEKRETMNCT